MGTQFFRWENGIKEGDKKKLEVGVLRWGSGKNEGDQDFKIGAWDRERQLKKKWERKGE